MRFRKFLSNGTFISPKFLVIVAVFGVLGGAMLAASHAATPTAAMEAELGTLADGATVVSDGTASGGSALLFGKTVVMVPASVASDCSLDVTADLVNWIGAQPNGTNLGFGAGKCYRVDGTIEFRGRSNLAFYGNGATFKSVAAMTTGNATDDQRAMWRVIGSTNISFSNMNLTGSYTKGGTFDATLQHAHGIDIRGTSATISSLHIINMAGDCAYYGLGYDNTTRSTGSFTNTTCTGTGRNGVSLTAANNMSLTGNTMDNIGYTAYDLEPNVGTYTATTGWGTSGIDVSNNTIGKYYLYAFALVQNAPNANDSFKNNTLTGSSGLRIGVVNPGGSVRSTNVTITGNTATVAAPSGALEIHNIDGVTVTGNTIPIAGSTMATVDNSCTVNVSGNTYPGATTQVKITNTPANC